MVYLQRLVLSAAVSSAVILSGCGGSSSGASDGDDGGSGVGTETTTISGTAEAPAGAVASLEPVSALEIAMNFLVSPAAAAITGLQPLEGATVELIRVNNAGEQQGELLASAITSITGDYNLEIPAGTSLAGDLVVRIQGSNAELRAQAVDQDVDINPISEYVLQKFIQKGTELSSLTTTSVVELTGKAEEFDIAATSDLSTMIEALETEMGDFIDGQVTQITSDSADVTEIAGDWRSVALEFGLGDSDGDGFGSIFVDSFGDNFTFADGGEGVVNITLDELGEGEATLNGSDGGNAFLDYFTEISAGETENATASYLDGGIMIIETPFEEEIDGDVGFRYPPSTLQFQKVAGKNVMFLVASDPLVRYRVIDTNGDGEPDAIDPGQKEGDEILYSVETFVKKPTNADNAGLAGDFGRIYLGTYLENNVYEVENERNVISFKSDGTLDIGSEDFLSVARYFDGSTMQTEFREEVAAGDTGVPFSLQADGRINNVGGDPANIQVNDTLDLVMAGEFEGAQSSFASLSKTIMVRLPQEGAPDLSARNYRVQFLAMDIFETVGVEIRRSRFDSTMSFADNTSATIDLAVQAAGKFTEGLADEIEVTTDNLNDSAVDVTVNADGSATLVIGSVETGGPTTAEGFFNQDGSIGVFRTRYDEDGDGTEFETSELGLMILAELP